MKNLAPTDAAALEAVETREWLESLDYVLRQGDKARVVRLLDALRARARQSGVKVPFSANTPYVNSIPVNEQVAYPGDREIERRIKSLVRWNAMAMVVRGNRESDGIGGHISTFASSATLYEVAFNHFFRGKDAGRDADIIYFQGHASPGIYSRGFLEGRFNETHLRNFRHELRAEPGLSSYPHPWLMPDFWEFPTVSMGLGPLMAIYQARFSRYLENRGLKEPSDQKIWAFLGDGETDEPEALGSLSLASREKLDNLIFVVNCNLQRLDGPVRGNGQIIQELESVFRGAGWNVIKVLWGTEWDDLLARDTEGVLVKRMGDVVDGEYQRYVVEDGAYIRKNFWGADPRLQEMVRHLSDDEVKQMALGGHDPVKVYNAYRAAMQHKGGPTVILARTVKGYGLGEAGEGKNITHQQKKMNDADLKSFRDRFGVPIPDDRIADAPFYRPDEKSLEIAYLKERRTALGGAVPRRVVTAPAIRPSLDEVFAEFSQGTAGRKASTTAVFVRMLSKLLRHPEIGKLVVPIVPDEARTFGMESLFKAVGIYSSIGQLYEPVDMATLLYYKEAKDGQILEEGITEAGFDLVVDRRRHRVCHARDQYHPVLHLLLDVRLPAGRRLHLGGGRCALPRFPARRHRRPDDAGGRGLAASGRQQPHARVHGADVPGLRPGLRLRAWRDHSGRHQADVRRSRGRVLLHHRHERAVRDAGDAEGRPGRHHQGPLPLQVRARRQGQGQGAVDRQRRDHERGRQGAGPAREVRRRRRRLERDELQRALP